MAESLKQTPFSLPADSRRIRIIIRKENAIDFYKRNGFKEAELALRNSVFYEIIYE